MAKPPSPLQRTASGPLRWAMLALAVVSLLLGVIGIFLPVLPTVPFILLAAWAASRSSPRLAAWLENHPRFGHHIRDWHDGGVVPRPAKWTATIFMAASAVIMFLLVPQRWLVAVVSLGMAAVAAWLWRRPEHKPGAAGHPP